MNDTVTGDALAQAYELIEADKLDEAKATLKPLLESDNDNPDVWWLYAHAVKDTETARIALNTVIRLDPEYPEAFDLLKTLDQRSPSDSGLDSYKEPGFLPAAPPTLPDLPGSGMGMDDDLDDDFEDDEEDVSFFQRPAFWMGIIGIIVVLAIVVVVIRPFGGGAPNTTTDSQTATQTSIPTFLPSDTSQPIPTAGIEQADNTFAGLRESLSAFTIPDNGINVTSTSLGNTLLVSVCTTAGRGLRTLLPQVMDALAKANNLYSSEANAAGVRMMDCDSELPLLSIGVTLSDATAYADGSLNEQDFQSRWTPIQ